MNESELIEEQMLKTVNRHVRMEGAYRPELLPSFRRAALVRLQAAGKVRFEPKLNGWVGGKRSAKEGALAAFKREGQPNGGQTMNAPVVGCTKERHRRLQEALVELLACWITSTGKKLEVLTIAELVTWAGTKCGEEGA